MEEGGEVTREKTRIYVGGLGGAVTEDDLRKTFSPLGEVVAVDVVRTKGRSFAYLDFVPSSDKSLPKLFSTYNGCMWKGGKLRLEKAKEHYLPRLRREWQEESENASKASDICNTDLSESQNILEKSKKLSPADKTQIRIFFPKLGKVKSLGQVGIGKHKYSFQRIQIPSIPTYFCDCEEHTPAFIPTNKTQSSKFENESDGINEQELDIMNSVMYKIFERANPSKQETGNSESVIERGVSMAADEDDEEDHLTDEDNLIINVASGNDGLDLLGEMRIMMANQEPISKRPISSIKKRKRVDDSPKKKRKSPRLEDNNDIDPVIPKTSRNSQIRFDPREGKKTELKSSSKQSDSNSLRSLKSTWKDLIGQKGSGSTPFTISDIIPREKGNGIKEKKKPVKPGGDENELASFPETTLSKLQINKEPASEISIPSILANADLTQKPNESDVLPGASDKKDDRDLIRTARGESWRHKSSWTQLISTTSHTSFSISQIVPDISLEKHEQQTEENSFDLQPENKNLNVSGTAPIHGQNPDRATKEKKKSLSLGILESKETCLFMRTEASMKEWKKAKASLSGSMNKKKRPVNESA